MEKSNPLSELMRATMEQIRAVADANTIIGAPIQAEGVTLIPVSRLSLGEAQSFPPKSSRRGATTPSAAAAEPAPGWSRWLFWWSGETVSSCCPLRLPPPPQWTG